MTPNKTMTQIKRVLDSIQKQLETLQEPVGAPIKAKDKDVPPTLHQKAHDALAGLKGAAVTKKILQAVRKNYKTHSTYPRIYQALEYRKRVFGDVDRSNGVWSIKRKDH